MIECGLEVGEGRWVGDKKKKDENRENENTITGK